MKGKLYLVPNSLGSNNLQHIIPQEVLVRIRELDHFIVENVRNARRYLIRCGYEKKIGDIHFYVLNKHTSDEEKREMLNPCIAGNDTGIISEAGVPGVADPGAEIVKLAHDNKIAVIPLTGPSSILLAVMASGLNGQKFQFHGYLPVNPHERKRAIRNLESETGRTNASQVFIETPYRNNSMLKTILETCNANTLLCIACDLTLESEDIRTLTIGRWKKEKADYHKRPCIFIIG